MKKINKKIQEAKVSISSTILRVEELIYLLKCKNKEKKDQMELEALHMDSQDVLKELKMCESDLEDMLKDGTN